MVCQWLLKFDKNRHAKPSLGTTICWSKQCLTTRGTKNVEWVCYRQCYYQDSTMFILRRLAATATSIRLFPRKKSVATMLACGHHWLRNHDVRFRLTASAIARRLPVGLNMTSRGVGVSSAMAAHRTGERCLALSMLCCRKFWSPLGVCWLPHTCDSGPHSQADSATCVILKIQVFLDVKLCGWVSSLWCFERSWCLCLQGQAVQEAFFLVGLLHFEDQHTTLLLNGRNF